MMTQLLPLALVFHGALLAAGSTATTTEQIHAVGPDLKTETVQQSESTVEVDGEVTTSTETTTTGGVSDS